MKKKILIGFLNKGVKGAIPTITRAFIEGLKGKYDFVPFYMDRANKKNRTRINISNLYYFLVHYFNWIATIIIHRPDIAHFPITSYWNLEKSLLFLFTARLLGVDKMAGHLHGGAFEEFWKSLGSVRRKAALAVLTRLDAFIVLSRHWKNLAIDEIGLKESKVYEVNNPLENQYENSLKRISRDYRKYPATFISISGLTERKGILDSLRALGSIEEEYEYNIIGGEIEEGFISRITMNLRDNNLTDRVKILGEKYGTDKINLMKESDIYLLPSHIENFPLAIIEAACAGMPIITTPVGALPEFFDHMENIYYVQPGNIGEIRNAIEFMLNNPDERERLGRNARKLFEQKLSRERIMNQLDNVYRDIFKPG